MSDAIYTNASGEKFMHTTELAAILISAAQRAHERATAGRAKLKTVFVDMSNGLPEVVGPIRCPAREDVSDSYANELLREIVEDVSAESFFNGLRASFGGYEAIPVATYEAVMSAYDSYGAGE